MSSGHSERFPRLLGDVGGTNARFAVQLAPGRAFSEPRTLPCAQYPTIKDAIEHYLSEGSPPRPRWCALGIANPVTGDRVSMTNHHWNFSIRALKAELALDRLVVLNDFTALALALHSLNASELVQVGSGEARANSPIGLIGPGTGLGVSGLIPCGKGDFTPLRGEGGHVTLAAYDEREAEIISFVRRRYTHVSAERILSGPGLVDLYEACAAVQSLRVDPLTAAQISARAVAETDAVCVQTLHLFCAMLGTVSANLALTLGALGGIYIGGGIVPKLGDLFVRSPFRARFEQKGRFSGYLAQIPTYVVHAEYPGLLGAAQALERIERDPATHDENEYL